MTFAVLNENEIRCLLQNVTLSELQTFQEDLRISLREYSASTPAIDKADTQSANSVNIRFPEARSTTMFIPLVCPLGHGVKVLTGMLLDQNAKLRTEPGVFTIFSQDGHPAGILRARTMTAFGTALASSCLLTRRDRVQIITVFGSGLQAYWHIRLALIQHGHHIRKVNIINRKFSESSKLLFEELHAIPAEVKQREGWLLTSFNITTPGYNDFQRLLSEQLQEADVIFCCTASNEPLFDAQVLTSPDNRAKARLVIAVGSRTAQMRELPSDLLIQAAGPRKTPSWSYISQKTAREGGVIIVDTVDGALKQAGEIADARLTPEQLLEIGELFLLEEMNMERNLSGSNRSSLYSDIQDRSLLTSTASSLGNPSESGALLSHCISPLSQKCRGFPFRRRKTSSGSSDRRETPDHAMSRWLREGNVIYKSVGFHKMDIVVGLRLIELARKKGIGHFVDGF